MNKFLILTLLCISLLFSQVLQESFNGPVFPPEGWRVYNLEDSIAPVYDRSEWKQDGYGPHTQPGCAFCRKTYAGGQGGNPQTPNNDWLVTPRVYPTQSVNNLTFYYRGFNKNQKESLEIWVSKTGNTPADFLNPYNGSYRADAFSIQTWNYTLRIVSLESSINQPIYIAFRYCSNNTNRHGVFLDDINTNPTYPPLPKIPFDVGVIAINSPNFIIAPVEFYPSARIKNFSSNPASFETKCFIYNDQGTTVYSRAVQVNGLVYNNTVDLTFNSVTLDPGNYTIKFKTYLAGDQYLLNDSMTREFQVLAPSYHDVGVTNIIKPFGEITQMNFQPKIMVKNYGSQAEHFSVRIEIRNPNIPEPVYSDNALIDLPSLVSDEIEFTEFWYPAPILYPYQVTAFTQLADDQNRSNDTATIEVIIPLQDAKVGTIFMPLYPVYEPGQTIIPSALISNRSFTLDPIDIPSTFSIRKNIGTIVYTNTQTTLLGFCDDATVDYAPWIADTGTFTVKCKTTLFGDNRPNNDSIIKSLFIPFRDVAPVEIEEPYDVFLQQPIIPRAIVNNNGNYYINAPIEMTIKLGDDIIVCDTNYVTIFEGISGMVYFPSWTPPDVGNYNIRFRQIFPYDMNPMNDMISKDFIVQNPYIDLAITAIKAPKDSIAAGSRIYPRVTISNDGDVPVVGPIITTIYESDGQNLLYIDTVLITSPLLPNTERTLIFSQLDNITEGEYYIHSAVGIVDDNLSNNEKFQDFKALKTVRRDVGTFIVSEPKGRKPIGWISSMAIVWNYGTSKEYFQVQLKIYRINESLPIFAPIVNVELEPRQNGYIYFPNWAADIGTFTVRCTTLLAGDILVDNNFKDTIVEIYRPIIFGWVSQSNFGDSAGYLVKEGGALTYVPNKGIYAFRGNRTNQFFFYDVASNCWTAKADLGSILVGKGAALCNDGENRIYAITGNKQRYFYSYDITANEWLSLGLVPGIGTRPKVINGGSGLAYLKTDQGDFIYLVKGYNTYEFYAYSVQADSWITRAEVHRGPTTKAKVKDGSSLTTDGQYFIYLLKASSNEFHCYDITNNEWTFKGYIPATRPTYKKVGRGSSMAYCVEGTTGIPTIYTLKGNSSFEFWQYNIVNNSWFTRTYMFPGNRNKKVGAGGSLVYVEDQNVCYALKGNKTNEFWKYIPESNPINGDDDVIASTIQTTTIDNPTNMLNTYLKVYPKITNSAARIFYQVNTLQPMTIKLYNNTGALIKNVQRPLNAKTGMISLDVADVSAGVYFVKIETNDNKILEKIVVQK